MSLSKLAATLMRAPFKHNVTPFFKTPSPTSGLVIALLSEYLPAAHYTTVQPTIEPSSPQYPAASKNHFQCQHFFFLALDQLGRSRKGRGSTPSFVKAL